MSDINCHSPHEIAIKLQKSLNFCEKSQGNDPIFTRIKFNYLLPWTKLILALHQTHWSDSLKRDFYGFPFIYLPLPKTERIVAKTGKKQKLNKIFSWGSFCLYHPRSNHIMTATAFCEFMLRFLLYKNCLLEINCITQLSGFFNFHKFLFLSFHKTVQHKKEGRDRRANTARRTQPANEKEKDTRRVGCGSWTGRSWRLY